MLYVTLGNSMLLGKMLGINKNKCVKPPQKGFFKIIISIKIYERVTYYFALLCAINVVSFNHCFKKGVCNSFFQNECLKPTALV